jgi:hypothetical protein
VFGLGCSGAPPPESKAVSIQSASGTASGPAPPPQRGIQAAESLPDFLEVANIEQIAKNEESDNPKFAGRPYAISINANIPGAAPLRDELAGRLHGAGLLSAVAFEWFGDRPLERVDISVGSEVDLRLARSVLLVFGQDSVLPVSVARAESDQNGDRRRIYVGSLVDTGLPDTSEQEIGELLNPSLSESQFFARLPQE